MEAYRAQFNTVDKTGEAISSVSRNDSCRRLEYHRRHIRASHRDIWRNTVPEQANCLFVAIFLPTRVDNMLPETGTAACANSLR